MEHLREIDLIPFRGLVICLSLRIVLTFGALEGVFQICSFWNPTLSLVQQHET